MNARSSRRPLLTSAAAAAFLVAGCFVYHSSAAPLSASALTAKTLALTAPTTAPTPAPAAVKPHSVLASGGDGYRNSFPSLVPKLASYSPQTHSLLGGHIQPTTSPLTLVPFSGSEVVDITDTSGNVVKAPGSMINAAAAANEPTPNQVLHFKVQLSGTNASAVYIQFKDPDSEYQDINYANGGPLEHKVFTKDFTDFANSGTDDGSATDQLFNGQAASSGYAQEPHQTFTGNMIGTRQQIDRGTIGDDDATSYLTVGSVFPADQTTNGNGIQVKDGNDTHILPGIDTTASVYDRSNPNTTSAGEVLSFGAPSVEALFHPLGQEYECQYLNANDNHVSTVVSPSGYTGTADAGAGSYGTPYYLAGYDDQAANSFPGAQTEWLRLHQVGTSSQYEAYWASPHSPSDFYMDVIVVDTSNNWRIFDNIWGFSTLPFSTAHDILLVNDNALGQKFNASTPGVTPGNPVNLRPIFYGAESYFTDINEDLLPNAVETWVQPTGRTPKFASNGAAFTTDQTPVETIQGLGFNYDFFDARTLATTNAYFGGDPFVYNGLGYFSYDDVIAQRQVVAPVPTSATDVTIPALGSANVEEPKSQAYSIWRVLSRGRVPASVYTAYEPTFLTQPAVHDPVSGFTAPAADGTAAPQVVNAPRCVIWLSPFSGDEPLNVAGSITDANVQNDLRAYVNAGGRLFVNGQEVASALTLNGQVNTGPGFFLYDVLNATLNTLGDQETFTHQVLNGSSGVGNQISFDSLINESDPTLYDGAGSDFTLVVPQNRDFEATPFTYSPPSSYDPLYVGNNYTNVRGEESQWRTDGALTEIGPATKVIGNATIQGKINSVNPVNGAKSNFTNGDGTTLIYGSNYTSTQGSGFGSRVVFSSFGLEGLGSAFVRQPAGNQNFFSPHNVRRDILHNVISYLRTGTFKGSITEELSSGGTGGSTTVGVAGATVYLLPFRGVDNQFAPGNISLTGGRQCYSGTTSDGTQTYTDGSGTIPVGGYEIDGVEPGMYQVYVYKAGFTRDNSPVNNADTSPFIVYGDTTATVNLSVTPLPPGSVSGTVHFSDGTAASGSPPNDATVVFRSTDGSTTVTAPVSSDGTGTYSASLPPGTYTGTATSVSPAATDVVSNITVSANNATTVNFTLQLLPATISGRVTHNGAGYNGATVTFTPSGGGTVQTTTTATVGGVVGSFTSPSLAAGTYTVSATATNLIVGTITPSNPFVLTTGQTVTGVTITLVTAPPATLSGTVTAAVGGAALSGATVTVTQGTSTSTLTTNASGVYTTSLTEGTYTVTASAYGYQTQTQTVNITTPTATLDFALAAGTSLTSYTPGRFNLVSWPYTTPFTSAFGPVGPTTRSVAFNYQNGGYIAEGSNLFPVDEANPGYGYFIKFYAPRNVYSGGISGTAPTGSTVSVVLNPGWNMIGVPSTSGISVSRLSVLVNGSVIFPFDSASSGPNVYVSPVLYRFDPTVGTAGQYEPEVSATGRYTALNNAQTQMLPFQGYWIYAYPGARSLTLSIPTGGG